MTRQGGLFSFTTSASDLRKDTIDRLIDNSLLLVQTTSVLYQTGSLSSIVGRSPRFFASPSSPSFG